MGKKYTALSRIECAVSVDAGDIKEAREEVKDKFKEDFGFLPEDSEIIGLKESE